eukprot:CAMPEP_0195035604 /NCGR_PEP_ID=MMETSP0326_2-20130528/70631_1 /TAXON_ID=2866 ORGANISM="Crypthecodinium cohnii, Strain Seligo" /NCGR_SAMPLE_ID=MMETSP0326_2 /ASSEMBLY_ACC=CAM_ASM_000348 /LENGTH=94 /DNA_ID=CAMNT_0040060849 /DNA_START=143 /DNA_END=424 /DNA_ORIENTATION=+
MYRLGGTFALKGRPRSPGRWAVEVAVSSKGAAQRAVGSDEPALAGGPELVARSMAQHNQVQRNLGLHEIQNVLNLAALLVKPSVSDALVHQLGV